jgi:hypothetical protein
MGGNAKGSVRVVKARRWTTDVRLPDGTVVTYGAGKEEALRMAREDLALGIKTPDKPKPDETDPKIHYRRYLVPLPRPKVRRLTYLRWLEGQFRSLVRDHVGPDADDAGTMTREQAESLFLNRTYALCCLAERFEPSGRFVGNGHHFAQRMSRLVADEFLKQWNERKPCDGCSHGRTAHDRDRPCAGGNIPRVAQEMDRTHPGRTCPGFVARKQ